MGGLQQKLKIWWQEADRTQKMVTILGSAFLILLLAGTFYFASRPHMALAFSNLDSAEVGTVSDEITKLGIPVTYDVDGNVEVPADKVAEVRAKLAEAGKLPAAGHMGSDELAKFSPLDPPSVENERLKAMLQDQLAESIENIQGIDKAVVNLNLGTQTVFEDEQKPATASVEVTLAPNAVLAPSQGRVIAMLVANAVTGLSPDKVFVMDNSGHTLYDATNNGGEADGSQGNPKLEQEIAETNRRRNELQQALDSTFGRGNTLVEVNLELDDDKTVIKSDLHPTNPAVSTEQKSTEQMMGAVAPAGGVNNINNAITPRAAGGSDTKSYSNTVTEKDHPVDEKQTETEVAPGALKSMAISVLVNSTDTNINPTQVDAFLKSYIAPWNGDSHFTESATSVPFDTTAQTAATETQKADQGRRTTQQIISILPIAALIFVGLLVGRAIMKAAKTPMFAALPGGGMVAFEGRHRGGGEEADAAELPQRELEDQITAENIAPIQEKLNLPLEQIKRMSEEKPENVAMLIKTWLLEDHK